MGYARIFYNKCFLAFLLRHHELDIIDGYVPETRLGIRDCEDQLEILFHLIDGYRVFKPRISEISALLEFSRAEN